MHITIAGQATERGRAKIDDWGRVDIELPDELATEEGRATVAALVALAEESERRLVSAIAHVLTDMGDRGDTVAKAAASPPLHAFGAAVERGLRWVLASLTRGDYPLVGDDTIARQAMRLWRTRLIAVVGGAWDDTVAWFGTGTSAVVAVARREGLIYALERDLIGDDPWPRVRPFTQAVRRQLIVAEAAEGRDELTARQAAVLLGVSGATVRDYARRGLLTPRKLDARRNLYPRAQVEAIKANPPQPGNRTGRPRHPHEEA